MSATGTVIRMGTGYPEILLRAGLDPAIARLDTETIRPGILELRDAPDSILLGRLAGWGVDVRNPLARGIYLAVATRTIFAEMARLPEARGVTLLRPEAKFRPEAETFYAGKLFVRRTRPVPENAAKELEALGFRVVSFDQAVATFLLEGPITGIPALTESEQVLAVEFWRRPAGRR